jgi:tRNA threonylcarbamoyladenosine biosynthesis protein TsaB
LNLLGLDTSTVASAACVLRADGEAFEVAPDPGRLLGPPRHARELLPAVARVMDASGLGWAELDGIAVGRGPGSFTGLRVGVATARALAQAHGLPLHPVSSLAALAAAAGPGRVAALIDARRGELFAALYDGGVECLRAWVSPPERVVERLRAERAPVRAVGDGAVRWRAVLDAGGIEVAPSDSPLHVVRALELCRLAAAVPGTAPEAVLPDYLRDPDATPAAP